MHYDLEFTKGDFVNYYLRGETRYILYSLFNFFVEVEFNITQNKIMNLIVFAEGRVLDRYWILTDLKSFIKVTKLHYKNDRRGVKYYLLTL